MKKKIKRLKKRLNILTKALGFKWVDCPKKYDVNLPCEKGYMNWGRGPRECSECDGMGKVLKKNE